jgi:hypothetical protein
VFQSAGSDVSRKACGRLEHDGDRSILQRARSLNRLPWNPAHWSLRESNPEVDVLLAELKLQLDQGGEGSDETALPEMPRKSARVSQLSVDELADLVAKRVCAYLEKRLKRSPALK